MSGQAQLDRLAQLAHEAMLLGLQPEFQGIAVPNALAHPGFTGEAYDFEGSGTLVIGMNRGGSTVSATDPVENRSLLILQERSDASAYQSLSERCFQVLENWKVWGRNLSLLFQRVGVPLNSVAYIHAVPFRVFDNTELNSIYRGLWQRFTVRQFEVLNPGRVLFAGRQVGSILGPLMPKPYRIVPRTGRDIAYPNHHGVAQARRVAETHDQIVADQAFWDGN